MKTIYVIVGQSDISERLRESHYLPSRLDRQNGMNLDLDNIITYDLTVFCFDTLNKDYNVILLDGDQYISLSELLNNTGEYTTKHMRIAHNVLKMFIGGAFNWRSIEHLTFIKK